MEVTGKIAILLATYNGAKYLDAQLDSLLKQTFTDFHVIIRDDGSNDNTREILKYYIQKYPTKFSLIEDQILHRGAKDSFLYLLEQVEAPYYMFCDQDDVWLPDKVEISIGRIKKIESIHPQKAIMVHTDLKIVDQDLNTIYESLWKWAGFKVDLNKNFNFAVMGNVFTGCTMIINSEVKKIVFPVHPRTSMHDEWIGLIVAKKGIVDNIKSQTILYRQHGNNVCSTGEKKDFSKQKLSLKILYKWYYENYELLSYLGYGSVFKAVIFKALYLLRRRFQICVL